MRVIIFWVVALTVLPLVSYAQVDTLELVEIGNIQASSEITELYIEDLDGDSLKEIIICTDYFVYIYDSQTHQVEWTSPPLLSPTDLLFEDINGDGLIDLSVKDSTNIHLFDPHTPGTIWTSPTLDSTYSCYTIGDRNDDDLIDVAIVSKEWFTRHDDPDNLDTVWVDIYDGPTFEDDVGFLLLLPNYNYGQGDFSELNNEIPKKIILSKISASSCLRNRLYVVTNSYNTAGDLSWFSERISGRIWMVSALNLEVVYIYDIGRLLLHGFICSNDSTYFYTFGSRSYFFNSMWGYSYDISKTVYTFSAERMVRSSVLWENTESWVDWMGFVVGETNDGNNGNEVAFGAGDSLCLFSFPGLIDIWTNSDAFNISSIPYIYASSTLFSGPQIICAIGDPLIEYNFFSGANGALSSILPDPGFELSRVANLDGNGNDEILSIQGSALYIYGLDIATGVGDNTRLPQRAFLRPNYPNPFNSSTTIEYGLPEAGHVNIEIYDLLGRKVETLVNEEIQAGRHQVVWGADRYASGLYFYRIEAGDYSDTKRMVYLK